MNRYIICLFLLAPVSVSAYQENGFIGICQIFTEALSTNMDTEQKNVYIRENIKTRINSRDALSVYSAIFNLEPHKRYEIFKMAAEESTKEKWSCDIMEEAMSN